MDEEKKFTNIYIGKVRNTFQGKDGKEITGWKIVTGLTINGNLAKVSIDYMSTFALRRANLDKAEEGDEIDLYRDKETGKIKYIRKKDDISTVSSSINANSSTESKS